MSVNGVGRAPSGLEAAAAEDADLEALAFETLASEHDRLEADARVGAEALARLQGTPRTVDDALAAPSPEHVARALAAERAAAVLARVVRRGGRPGEPKEQERLRALVARLLELRHEAAAGMGKVSLG